MDLDQILVAESPALKRRLRALAGSSDSADDLVQETLARALVSAPRNASPQQTRAWLHRVATNLALDDFRRRARRRVEPLDDELTGTAVSIPLHESLTAREALARLNPHHRLLLLLRFEGGFSHAEIAALLDISEPAARQRLSRARRAFGDAFRRTPLDGPPRVYVAMGKDESVPYMRWLSEAGADVRELSRERFERELAQADAVVVGGSRTDVHPAVYGEARRAEVIDPDLARDRQDLAIIRAALEQDVPLIGICRGHQLLNVAFGGTLHQDIGVERGPSSHHERHSIRSASGSFIRRVLGSRAGVSSRHHQAVKQPGRGLQVVSLSDDGLIEAVELPRRRFALGVQFHPEDEPSATDRLLASALVDAAARRAA